MLYRRRALTRSVDRNSGLGRAFDKAVRRKPLAFAADAGLWRLKAAREERVANSATLKRSCRVVLGMSTWVKQGLVR